MDDDETPVRSDVRRYVWSGYYDEIQILRIVGEDVFAGAVKPEVLRGIIKDAFAEKLAEEVAWSRPTDCDLVDDVFRTLESNGILAMQNAGCTRSESMSEMSDRYYDAGGTRSQIRGYCIFDREDLEHVQVTGKLYQTFGDIAGNGPRGIEIGHEIRRALEAVGFVVVWDGSLRERLIVTGIKWQRRSGGAA